MRSFLSSSKRSKSIQSILILMWCSSLAELLFQAAKARVPVEPKDEVKHAKSMEPNDEVKHGKDVMISLRFSFFFPCTAGQAHQLAAVSHAGRF